MNFFTKFLQREYTNRPAPTLQQKLASAEKELRHYTRPYHDMEFMERQVIYWAQRVVLLRAQVAAAPLVAVNQRLAEIDKEEREVRQPCPCGDWSPSGPCRPGHPDGWCDGGKKTGSTRYDP